MTILDLIRLGVVELVFTIFQQPPKICQIGQDNEDFIRQRLKVLFPTFIKCIFATAAIILNSCIYLMDERLSSLLRKKCTRLSRMKESIGILYVFTSRALECFWIKSSQFERILNARVDEPFRFHCQTTNSIWLSIAIEHTTRNNQI